jgi:hypothetical protein
MPLHSDHLYLISSDPNSETKNRFAHSDTSAMKWVGHRGLSPITSLPDALVNSGLAHRYYDKYYYRSWGWSICSQ